MRTLLAALIAATLIAPPPADPSRAGEIPAVLSYLERDGSSRNPFPDWVSASRAVTPSGELDPTVLSPASRSILDRFLGGGPTAGDCIEVFVSEDRMIRKNRPGPRTDLATAIRTSDWVFKGEVRAREVGFQGATPGTLFQVLPETTFKGPAHRFDRVYFFVPVGEAPVGEQKLCIRNSDYAALPEIGDEVLLLAEETGGPFLWTGNETGIITLSRKGEVSLPKRYRSEEKALEGKSQGAWPSPTRQMSLRPGMPEAIRYAQGTPAEPTV